MSKQVKYCIRGKAGDVAYKLVNGAFRRFSEARGEDSFPSRFTAIYHGAQAARAWRMRPQGLVLDVHERQEDTGV